MDVLDMKSIEQALSDEGKLNFENPQKRFLFKKMEEGMLEVVMIVATITAIKTY